MRIASGDSYDNAMAESVIGLYKTECVTIDGPFRTVAELELATLFWTHWYNEQRLHSAIGYVRARCCWTTGPTRTPRSIPGVAGAGPRSSVGPARVAHRAADRMSTVVSEAGTHFQRAGQALRTTCSRRCVSPGHRSIAVSV